MMGLIEQPRGYGDRRLDRFAALRNFRSVESNSFPGRNSALGRRWNHRPECSPPRPSPGRRRGTSSRGFIGNFRGQEIAKAPPPLKRSLSRRRGGGGAGPFYLSPAINFRAQPADARRVFNQNQPAVKANYSRDFFQIFFWALCAAAGPRGASPVKETRACKVCTATDSKTLGRKGFLRVQECLDAPLFSGLLCSKRSFRLQLGILWEKRNALSK